MTITTQAQWFSAPRQRLYFMKPTTSGFATNYAMNLNRGSATVPPCTTGQLPLSNATSGVILTPSNFPGTYALDPWGTNTGYIASIVVNNQFSYSYPSVEPSCLYDVIYGVGPISLTSLGTTTLSGQPSLSGRIVGANGYEQLEMICEVCVANGSNTTTLSVSYTNEAGVSGSTSGTISFAGTQAAAGTSQRLTLQAGDRGVQQINSITVGGTASTAGSVNILIARKLAMWSPADVNAVALYRRKLVLNHELLCMPQIFQNSCLVVQNGAKTASQLSLSSVVVTVVNG